jgi:hypothetical protein
MPTRKAPAVKDSLVDDQASIATNGTRNVDVSPTVTIGRIEVPRINIQEMELILIGDSPLICHRWSEKAKQQMLDKQMKRATEGKAAKDPQKDYEDSLYHHPDGGYGFPCIAFKNAGVSACRFTDGLKMTEARGAFHVMGEMVQIEGTPSMREDTVKIAMGTADIRYRAEFKTWRVRLRIRYNVAVFSASQICNLFNLAGFGVGIGEWRPERDGSYGCFHVAEQEEGT